MDHDTKNLKEFVDVGEKSPLYILGHFGYRASTVRWGHWDLNPDQRVSTTQGATPRELYGSTLQFFITWSANPLAIIPV